MHSIYFAGQLGLVKAYYLRKIHIQGKMGSVVIGMRINEDAKTLFEAL